MYRSDYELSRGGGFASVSGTCDHVVRIGVKAGCAGLCRSWRSGDYVFAESAWEAEQGKDPHRYFQKAFENARKALSIDPSFRDG
jgi:hypothetical protein